MYYVCRWNHFVNQHEENGKYVSAGAGVTGLLFAGIRRVDGFEVGRYDVW